MHVIALAEFLKRTYFTRLWIIQEVIVSRNPMILFGESTLRWIDLELFLNMAWANPGLLAGFRISEAVYVAQIERVKKEYKHGDASLLRILGHSRNSDSSDPRDQIFGLVSLSNQKNNPLLRPDYLLDRNTIFWNVASQILNRGSERFRLLAFSSSSLEGLPSWVPDWNNRTGQTILADVPWFCAGNVDENTKFQIGSREDPILRLPGLLFDEVDRKVSTPKIRNFVAGELLPVTLEEVEQRKADVGRAEQKWLNECRDLARSVLNQYSHNDIEDAVRKTPVCGFGGPGDPTFKDIETAFTAFEQAQSWLQTRGCEPFPLAAEANIYSTNLCIRSNRCFASTRILRIACIPEDAISGDIFCIFQGGPVPFILRRQGNSYRIIGECYVHGEAIMEGNFIKQKKADLQEICLT
jgi:hypothetical protein